MRELGPGFGFGFGFGLERKARAVWSAPWLPVTNSAYSSLGRYREIWGDIGEIQGRCRGDPGHERRVLEPWGAG